MKNLKRFDVVQVQLYDARIIQGTIVSIEDTVGGPKVRVLSGDLLARIDPAQILRKVSSSPRRM